MPVLACRCPTGFWAQSPPSQCQFFRNAFSVPSKAISTFSKHSPGPGQGFGSGTDGAQQLFSTVSLPALLPSRPWCSRTVAPTKVTQLSPCQSCSSCFSLLPSWAALLVGKCGLLGDVPCGQILYSEDSVHLLPWETSGNSRSEGNTSTATAQHRPILKLRDVVDNPRGPGFWDVIRRLPWAAARCSQRILTLLQQLPFNYLMVVESFEGVRPVPLPAVILQGQVTETLGVHMGEE